MNPYRLVPSAQRFSLLPHKQYLKLVITSLITIAAYINYQLHIYVTISFASSVKSNRSKGWVGFNRRWIDSAHPSKTGVSSRRRRACRGCQHGWGHPCAFLGPRQTPKALLDALEFVDVAAM